MTLLDRLFHSVLSELKYGYVTTYAIDCAKDHNLSPDTDTNIKAMCDRKEE